MTETSTYDKQLAWKQLGQRKLASKSNELRAQTEQECTFSPKTNTRSMRTKTDEITQTTPLTAAEIEAVLLHPTESQESSINLHLARQEKARVHAHDVQQKLNGVQNSKDYTKCTTKPRQSTIDLLDHSTGGDDGQMKLTNIAKGGTLRPGTTCHRSGSSSATGIGTSRASATEAVRVAERFAAATEAFEERLVTVEQSAAKELEEVNVFLLAKQPLPISFNIIRNNATLDYTDTSEQFVPYKERNLFRKELAEALMYSKLYRLEFLKLASTLYHDAPVYKNTSGDHVCLHKIILSEFCKCVYQLAIAVVNALRFFY
ncbi:hypothetical protein Plhal304r1_c073g0161001 [Plasmopara halstedii]